MLGVRNAIPTNSSLPALLVAIAYVWQLFTYNPTVHGPLQLVGQTWLVFFLAAASSVILILLGCGCALRPAVACHQVVHGTAIGFALVLLLVPAGVHAARLVHPVNVGRAFWVYHEEFSGPVLAERLWRWHIGHNAQLRVAHNRAEMENAPGQTIYLEAEFLRHNPSRIPWLQPIGLTARRYRERLEWTATVERTGEFFMVLEAEFERQLLWVQVTTYGMHVTFSDATGKRTGHEIVHPVGQGNADHRWTLVRNASALTLELDRQRLWSAPPPRPMTRLRFGEVVSDQLHGGSLSLASVHYERKLE